MAAFALAHQTRIGALATLLTLAVPVGAFLVTVYGLYYHLVRTFDALHILLLGGTAAVFAASIVAVSLGVDLAVCLVILTLAPIVTVVGYEIEGYLLQKAALARQGHRANNGSSR